MPDEITKPATTSTQEMTLPDVSDFCGELERLQIEIWIDGGWGVDALLGTQTRPHKDLDIALEHKDISRLCKFLEARGYNETKRDNEWNFVMADCRGHEIDLHAFIFDDNKKVVGGLAYPTESLTGIGTLNGRQVKCISPEWMVKFHSGYELKEKDFRDVSALCEKFHIALPEEFAFFKRQSLQR